MKRLLVKLLLCIILFTFGCAQVAEKSATNNTVHISKKQVSQTWAIASLPDKNDRFYYNQRTFDEDGTIKGFISYRHLTDAPKYEELGRVLVVGKWRLDGNMVIIRPLGYLPPHKELSTEQKIWTIKELTFDTMILESGGKKVSLVKAVVGHDPNKTGSNRVKLHTDKVLDLGF